MLTSLTVDCPRLADPFIGFNEIKAEWVGLKSWTYRVTIARPSLSHTAKAVLAFDGLDTFATVKLGGKTILESDNMFLPTAWMSQIPSTTQRPSISRLNLPRHFSELEKSKISTQSINLLHSMAIQPVWRCERLNIIGDGIGALCWSVLGYGSPFAWRYIL